MTKTAFIFPGQGSQKIGMGKAIAEAYPEARAVFDAVNEALNQDLSALMFGGDEAELTLTENTQPALMATSLAIMAVLKAKGFNLKDQATYVAGHSLGEYSALCAAEAIGLKETAKLLKTRGESMQQAVPVGQGAMAAVLGLEFDAVAAIAKEISDRNGVVETANDNSPGQVVVSGTTGGIEQFITLAQERGAKRCLKLPVSAPFHSSLMKPAAEVMRGALSAVEIKAPIVPLIANVTADATQSPIEIQKLLVEQVTGRVRWRESVEKMVSLGVTRFVEVGSGKVLSGLVKRIAPDAQTVNIETPEDVEGFLK